jgi:hypothetical protein
MTAITSELEAAGIDFQIERGGKHLKVRCGRHVFIASFSNGARGTNWRTRRAARANVRRMLKREKEK